MKKISGVLLIFAIIISILVGCGSTSGAITSEKYTSSDYIELPSTENYLDEDGSYSSKGDVGLYIHLYGKLPLNFITKKQAQALGWDGGSLEQYAPGKCIGGSYFGNYEGLLPSKDGRVYTECDIDTLRETKKTPIISGFFLAFI
ncbi:MAG: ribonuclease domain-containing protein [Eubacteriales bacterium]|nr:ribonuclease domain-containing protein [Eubacteriales bacterium]MDD4475677.1 ribonuclease domain-containing protein [Eubacteriales bacterium]